MQFLQIRREKGKLFISRIIHAHYECLFRRQNLLSISCSSRLTVINQNLISSNIYLTARNFIARLLYAHFHHFKNILHRITFTHTNFMMLMFFHLPCSLTVHRAWVLLSSKANQMLLMFYNCSLICSFRFQGLVTLMAHFS